MIVRNNCYRTRFAGRLASIVLLGGAVLSGASPITFTIDQAESSLTISGNVAGGALQPQGPGGLTSTFTGSLLIKLADNSIQVMAGSQIDALTNGIWEPGPGGAAGSAPGDFGGKAEVGSGFFTLTAKAALRNLLLDVTSSAIPLSDGQFDASGMLFAFSPSGTSALDYNATLLSGSEELTGLATNSVTSKATLATSGQSQVLTIPINASSVFKLLSANDSLLVLQGQLVARSGSPPVFEIVSVRVQDGNLKLEWNNAPGKQYQVEHATQMGQWTVLATGLAGSGSTITWSSPLPGARGFYRIGMK